MTAPLVLVTGATGAIGAAVVRNLRQRGVSTRAFVRDRARAADMLGEDVELAVGDLGDAESIRRALHGVQRLLLCTPNHVDQLPREMGVIDAAAEARLERVVKIGAGGTSIDSPLAFWNAHARIESYLHMSGLPMVMLRPSMYMTNLLATAPTVRNTGRLIAPAGTARIAMIDPRDVADAATVALTEDGHEGRCYTLTGSEAVTYDEIASQIALATGRPVQYVDVPDTAAREGMKAVGVPDWFADQLIILWRELRQGAGEMTTDAVHGITGRSPRRVAEFVLEHANKFSE